MAWDPAAGYVVLFGGTNLSNPDTEGSGVPNLDDTWAFSNGSWTQLFPAESPPATSFGAMAYDPNASAVILFGGEVPEPDGATPVNTTWEFDDGTWTNVTAPVAPAPRLSPSLAEDPSRGGLVLFGGLEYFPYGTPSGTGLTEVPESDTWSFSAGAWINITESVGPGPPARYLASMAYDPAESAEVLFGGWVDLGDLTPTFNDTWTLGSTGWNNVTPAASPPVSGGASMAYLSDAGSVILYGGSTPLLGHDYNLTWSFSDGVWTRLNPASVPPGTFAGTFADDPTAGYGVLLLGVETPYAPASEQTWAFAQDDWTLAGSNSSLPPGGGETMVYDPASQEVVLVPNQGTGFASGSTSTWVYRESGWSELSTTIADGTLLVYDVADGYLLGFETSFGGTSTWEFSNNTWTELHPSNSPTPGESGGITYDAHDGYVLFYDYTKGGGNPSTWKWSGGDWTNLNLTTQPNLGHNLAINTMTYDAADGYVLLVQESNFTCGPAGYCLLTWAFSDGVWTDLTGESAQTPPLLSYTSISYDPMSQEVILFGGDNFTSGNLAVNETWAFRAGQWINLSPASSPPARYDAALTYDPKTGQVLAYGGDGTVPNGDGGSTYYPLADMWAFSNDTWTELIPFLSATLPRTDIGVPTILTLLASTAGGSPSYQYTGLPQGCMSANAAIITCDPAAAGTYHVTAALAYAAGGQWNPTTTLTVANLPSVTEFTATRNPALPNSTTTLSAVVAGGTAPLTYAYAGLPPGCSSADAGSIQCTPTKNGSFSVSIEVTDRFGRSAKASLELVVGAVPVGPSLGADLEWLTTPLGELVLGALLITAASLSVVTLRARRLRREGEQMIGDMRKAVHGRVPPGNRPP
jgi:hypothetical protein